MRTVALFVVVCIAAVAIGFAVRGCGGANTRTNTLDDIRPHDIASMVVQREGVLGRNPAAPTTEPFIPDPDDHAKLLGLVQGGEVDHNPAKWVVLGGMELRLRSGRAISVALFWTGQDRGAYRIGGTYHRGSSDEEIIRTVTECAKRGKPAGK